ncbi:hypothetical protein [Microcoleus sp.]|uniref:hypothetical protein n=1 Tax=Microcoleus sp. TaxID=44472 RepID=UPI003592FF5B
MSRIEGRRKFGNGLCNGCKSVGKRKKEEGRFAQFSPSRPLSLSLSPKRSNFCSARSTFRLPSQCYILQKYSKSLLEKYIFQLK